MLGLLGLLLLPTPNAFPRGAGGGSGGSVTHEGEHPLVHLLQDIDSSTSTYTKTIRRSAGKLGKNPTNPPAVDVYGITHVLEFTVDTDKAYFKQAIPTDYAGGDFNVHFHWTKSTDNDDQSGLNVEWQIKYLVINGTSEDCSAGEATDSIVDTYDSAIADTQIVYQTGNITIPDGSIIIHDMILIEIMAVTTATPLNDDPALVYFDVEYLAYHIP